MSIDRLESITIKKRMTQFPVVGIIGARQIGKTTLAKSLLTPDALYIDLESDLDTGIMSQPGLFLRHNKDKLIVIDEVQRVPELFPLLRSIIDEDRRNGRMILLGSASPNLLRNSSESLAGRIAYVELTGLNILETGKENMLKLWSRGGFPVSFLSNSDEDSYIWRKQLIKSYIERDLPLLGLDANKQILSRLVTMLAGGTTQQFNASMFAKSLGISAPTVRKYVDFLQNAFVLDLLPAYHLNIRKRLVKSPKIYFRDTGLLHVLLNLTSYNDLLGNIICGPSWENFAIAQIKSIFSDRFEYYYYRTQDGSEADLILTEADNPVYSLEFKFSNNPKPTKGTHLALADIGTSKNFIITPDSKRYPLTDNLEAINLDAFVQQVKSDLSQS